MTNEEIIKNLKKLKSFHNGSYGTSIDEAIKLLEQQLCGDCVNRDALINELKCGYWDKNLQSAKNDPCIVDAMIDWSIRTVKSQPSVTPQPKTGEWIKEHHTIKCNNCNTIIFTSCDYNDRQEYRDMVMDDYIEQYRYCPFCGSRMNGGGEDAEELTK